MPEADRPIPKRFYWLKRLGVGFVVFLLLLIGLRLWWGHRANTRLNSLIAEIEARGEPIHFEDMLRDPVPDRNNKAYYLRQALAQWPAVPGRGVRITETDWYGDMNKRRTDPDPITDDAAYLEQVRSLLTYFKQAEAAPGCDWGHAIQSPALYTLLPSLGDQRRLTRLIDDAVRRAADIGDTGLTLQLLLTFEIPATAVNRQPPTLIGHLVGTSILAMEYEALAQAYPQLVIDSHTDHPSRVLAERLLTQLLDEKAYKDSLIQAWMGERWMTYDTAKAVFEGRAGINSLSFSGGGSPRWNDRLVLGVFRPLLVNDAYVIVRIHDGCIQASGEADSYAGFEALFNDYISRQLDGDVLEELERGSLLYPISRMLAPSYDSALRAHYRLLSRRRLAAAAVAIKLYEADHGRRPATLDELVPDYLPAVPIDPMAADGATIGYRPQGALLLENANTLYPIRLPATGPAIVYSIGQNGTDRGGAVAVDVDGKVDEHANGHPDYACDTWFLLDNPAESYLPADETVDGDEDSSDLP